MVNSCANPECRKTLRYLRDGIVYLFSCKRETLSGSDASLPDAILPKEHFWLCGACAVNFALKSDHHGSVQLIQRTKRRKHLPETETGHALPYAAV